MHVKNIQYCLNKNKRLVFTDTKFIVKRIASIFLSDEKGLSILDTHIIDWEKALFPSRFVSTVVLNMRGIAGRIASAQQTRITQDHLRESWSLTLKPQTLKIKIV